MTNTEKKHPGSHRVNSTRTRQF